MQKYIFFTLIIFTLSSCTKAVQCPEKEVIFGSLQDKFEELSSAIGVYILVPSNDACGNIISVLNEVHETLEKWEGCAEKYGEKREWDAAIREAKKASQLWQTTCY